MKSILKRLLTLTVLIVCGILIANNNAQSSFLDSNANLNNKSGANLNEVEPIDSMLGDGAVWFVVKRNIQTNQNTNKGEYRVDGNAAIKNKTYKLIKETWESGFTKNHYLREEDDTVYYYSSFQEKEVLLYAFDVSVADTVCSEAEDGHIFYTDANVLVTNINTVTLENDEKRQAFEINGGHDIWIKDVGSIYGLLHPIDISPTNYTATHLACYKRNEIILYVNSDVCGNQTNTQEVFPDSNAIWNENPESNKEVLYGLYGDTIIDGKTYSKLYELSDTILSNSTLLDYWGGFRQEDKKVWFRPAYCFPHPDDILLYDFSAKIGDTVWHKATLFGSSFELSEREYSIVEDISYKDEGTVYSANGLEWYEGVGSDLGLFGPILKFSLSEDYFNSLACFKHNDTVRYQKNPFCDRCFCGDLLTNVSKNKHQHEIVISPNPTEDFLNIRINTPYQKATLEIYNCNGIKIYESSEIAQEITLPSSLGVLFLKLYIDGDLLIRKLVKI